MSEHFTTEEYKSLRLEWKKQLDKYPLQQLDPTPTLLNEFLEQLWSDSKKMMDLLTTTTTTESCNLIMQDFCFKQMKGSLYTRQRLFDILEAEPLSKKYVVASSSPSSLSLASSLSFSSCIVDSDSISKNSSELDNTPLLTNRLSSSTTDVNSIMQTSLDQTQIGIKQKEEEENDSISTSSSSSIKTDSYSKRLKLSPSPSTPTLSRSFTSSCEANFLPACNYLCYYPTYNSKKEKGGANTCHFCNGPITPLKKSFSMGDFSNRQLSDDDGSSCYTLDESTTFTDGHTSSHHKIGDSDIVINSNEFQPLLPISKDESNMEYCLITPTTKTEDRYLYYSNTLSSSSSITQGKQQHQQEEEEEENGYKHLSSISKDSDDDGSLDSIIQKHQDIISHYSLNSTSSKKKRRSMLRLFSHKKLSSFFSMKKKKKVDSVSSFYQKKMSELLI